MPEKNSGEYDNTGTSVRIDERAVRGKDHEEFVEIIPQEEDIPTEPMEGVGFGSKPIGNKRVRLIAKAYGARFWFFLTQFR
ncbi:MAG: hypothetical protein HYS21_12510 [Deltaproteobacteria bacterium]|nr:hypothetical protein [Deltaproteobacteria bacterium]